jgi:hypothetical protein
MKFRDLGHLRDRHRGEEIWILGRGPSLDDYPENFFNGKVTIAINWAFLAFPDSTYYYSFHAATPAWVAKNWPAKFNRCIIGCRHGSGPKDGQSRGRYGGSGKVPSYAKVIVGTGLNRDRFKMSVERLIAKESSVLTDSITTLHTAIQAAIVLGAVKITLTGCELVMREGRFHAQSSWLSAAGEKKLLRKRRKWIQKKFFPNSRRGLEWLVEICKPYGIEIVRYYYKKGYEQIEIP